MRNPDDFARLLMTILGGNPSRTPPKGKGPILDMTEVGKDHFVSKIEQAAQQGRTQTTMPLRSLAAS